jgi:hypothetical protein
MIDKKIKKSKATNLEKDCLTYKGYEFFISDGAAVEFCGVELLKSGHNYTGVATITLKLKKELHDELWVNVE